MDLPNLIRMANRIGEFFEAQPDRSEAMEGVAAHLHKFWESRMRRALAEHIRLHDGAGLHPLVLEALLKYRGAWSPEAG